MTMFHRLGGGHLQVHRYVQMIIAKINSTVTLNLHNVCLLHSYSTCRIL